MKDEQGNDFVILHGDCCDATAELKTDLMYNTNTVLVVSTSKGGVQKDCRWTVVDDFRVSTRDELREVREELVKVAAERTELKAEIERLRRENAQLDDLTNDLTTGERIELGDAQPGDALVVKVRGRMQISAITQRPLLTTNGAGGIWLDKVDSIERALINYDTPPPGVSLENWRAACDLYEDLTPNKAARDLARALQTLKASTQKDQT